MEIVNIFEVIVDNIKALDINIKISSNIINRSKKLVINTKQPNLIKSKNIFLTRSKNHN